MIRGNPIDAVGQLDSRLGWECWLGAMGRGTYAILNVVACGFEESVFCCWKGVVGGGSLDASKVGVGPVVVNWLLLSVDWVEA